MFSVCSLFFDSVYFYLNFCGLLEYFLEFDFDLSIVVFSICLCLAFSVVVLNIALHIHHLSTRANIYQFQESVETLLPFVTIYTPYFIIVLNISSKHIENHIALCYNFCFND